MEKSEEEEGLHYQLHLYMQARGDRVPAKNFEYLSQLDRGAELVKPFFLVFFAGNKNLHFLRVLFLLLS
jgi:hypothetical protein